MRLEPNRPGGGSETFHKSYIAHILRSTLKSLLGESGLRVLEFHLEKRLQGDMYEVFYENPHSFYKALQSFFGSGVDVVLRITAQKLIEEGYLETTNPQEFINILKNPSGDKRELQKIFKLQEIRKP